MGVRTLTLDPVEISRFLVRQKRDWGIDKLALRLDTFLAAILEKANEFVPSESGSLLLDDPRAKGREDAINTLTFIACFGPSAPRLLGRQIPVQEGIVGRVYSTGEPYVTQDVSDDEHFKGQTSVPLSPLAKSRYVRLHESQVVTTTQSSGT